MTSVTIPQTVLFPDLFDKPVSAAYDQVGASSDGGAVVPKAAGRVYGCGEAFAQRLVEQGREVKLLWLRVRDGDGEVPLASFQWAASAPRWKYTRSRRSARAGRRASMAARWTRCRLLAVSRIRRMLDFRRPQDVVAPAGIVRPACACVRQRQGASLRYRGTRGLDAGSAHGRQAGSLPTMPNHSPYYMLWSTTCPLSFTFGRPLTAGRGVGASDCCATPCRDGSWRLSTVQTAGVRQRAAVRAGPA